MMSSVVSTEHQSTVPGLCEARNGPYRRVVCCQGATQLASAVAAMWLVSGRWAKHTRQGRPIENHLVVHDLYSPDDNQTQEFYGSIQHLARQTELWHSCHYLGPEVVASLRGDDDTQTDAQSPTETVRERLGLPDCSELYLSQNSVMLYDLLRQAYPGAEHICFGDGVGLNFSRTYHSYRSPETPIPEKSSGRSPAKISNAFLKLNPWAGASEPPLLNHLPAEKHSFDQFCLLLPNLFDQKIENYHQLESEFFIELFARFAESFESKAPDTHAALTELKARSGTTVILLSSYFSEVGLMPREVEIDGYIEMLSGLPQGPRVDLIIKPHPRDSYEKLERLRELTASAYRQTLALSDPWTFYLPIESLIAKYFCRSRLAYPPRSTYVAAVGTSSITIEFLYGQRCEVGFNSESILERCSPDWRKLRSIHEYDLRRILPYVRNLRKSQQWKKLLHFIQHFGGDRATRGK